jgi:hypothetical protein
VCVCPSATDGYHDFAAVDQAAICESSPRQQELLASIGPSR